MLALPSDPYKALGVPRDAQLPEIRSAHRKLILKCHPDKVQDPQLKQEKQDEFQRVQQAYELLANEKERGKYDDMYKLNELQKEMSKMSTSSPASARSSRRDRDTEYYPNVKIRTAEPRASTFSGSPSSKPYADSTQSRSWENVDSRYHDGPVPRKTASYEREPTRPSKRDSEKEKRKADREWEKEQQRQREKEKEKEREREERRALRREKEKEKEKEALAREREREEKEREKKKKKAKDERKKEADAKTQRKTYIETFDDSDEEELFPAGKPSKKSSSGREKSRPPATTERERKNSTNLDFATQYLERSGANINGHRTSGPSYIDAFKFSHGAGNIPPAVATPPPAPGGPHAPPPPPGVPPPPRGQSGIVVDEEAEDIMRSSGKSSSRRSKESSSYKKASARGSSRESTPIVDIPTSGGRPIPSLQKSATMPPEHPHRAPFTRSNTDHFATRHSPPSLSRNSTWYAGAEPDTERSRSRHDRHHDYSDEDSEGEPRPRHSRRHRSPGPGPAVTQYRYTVDNGKTTRHVHPDEIRSHKSSSKNTYYMPNMPNTSATRAPMPGYDYPASSPAFKVKYSPQVDEHEIKYSGVQHAYHTGVY